jgi:hypothetical protein
MKCINCKHGKEKKVIILLKKGVKNFRAGLRHCWAKYEN